MNIKKIIAAATAAVIAVSVCAAATVSAETVYEKEYIGDISPNATLTEDGLIVDTSYQGEKFIGGYQNIKKDITIPKGYKSSGSFTGCEVIESVYIEADVEEINDNAFAFCPNLKKVTFAPKSKLKTIGDNAFFCCQKLTEINIPDSVTEIGCLAFANCEKLKSLTVPSKAKVGDFFAGFMYADFIEYVWGNPDNEEAVKADGKKSVTISYTPMNTDFMHHISIDNLKITQKSITLYVKKGSDAEKYAKANGIKYKYGSAAAAAEASSDPKEKKEKLAAPTNIKGSVADDRIILTWNKVSGAKAYRVYKYNPKDGKYYKYKDVKGGKCTVKGLKSGTKYKFKVYALTVENGKFVPQTPSKVVAFTTESVETIVAE